MKLTTPRLPLPFPLHPLAAAAAVLCSGLSFAAAAQDLAPPVAAAAPTAADTAADTAAAPAAEPAADPAAADASAVEAIADESASPGSGDDTEEVIVTATRRSTGVQEVPLNITAISAAAIADRKLEDLSDLVHEVPGLFLVDQGGRDSNLLTVRGLNVNSLSAGEGVGTKGGGVVAQYVGDIPFYVDLHLIDIERVEALLGPQGTLYGAGTLGGAIRYIPNRPKLGSSSLELQGGSYALSHSDGLGYESQAVGNLPIGDKAALRVALNYQRDPGFIDYSYLVRVPGVSDPEPNLSDPAAVKANLKQKKDANDLKTLTGRAALLYRFSDALEATLTYQYQDQNAGGRTINQHDSFGTGLYESAYRFLEPNERKFQLGSLELQDDLGFAKLTSATGYSLHTEDGQRDQTDLLLNFQYGYEDFPSFAAYTHETDREKQFTQEFRLVSEDAKPFNWIVGAFYSHLDTHATTAEYVPGYPQFAGIDRPDNLEYFQDTRDTFQERALFGELGYEISDQWTVTTGGRYFRFRDHQDVGFALPLVDGSAPTEVALKTTPVQVADDGFIFKLNSAYQFTPDLLGYATLSQGYRSGGANAVPLCQTLTSGQQAACATPAEQLIKPDKTLNHEIGLHSQWLDKRLTFNGALFYLNWTQVQVAGRTAMGAVPITVNGHDAATYGAELSTQWRILPSLRLSAVYSYTHAQLTQDAPGIVGGKDAFDGDRLPGSPRHQGNIALTYTRPAFGSMILDAEYDISAQSNVFTKVGLRDNGEALGGYAVHNTSVSLSQDAWTLRLYAKNLLDRYAATGVRNDRSYIRAIDPSGDTDNGDGFRLRSYYHSVLDPFRIGLTLSYRFGA